MQGTMRPHWNAPTPGIPHRLNAKGLRFFSAPADGGGAPTAGAAPVAGAGAEGQQAATPSPADVAARAAAQQQAGAGEGQQAESTLPDDPVALKAEIARLRKENAADRTGAKTKAAEDAKSALVQELGKALGLVQGDEAPDPAKLTEQLTAQQETARTAQLELAVFKAAGAKGADATALLDSRSFLTAVNGVDPTDSAAITAAIEKAITENPKFKAVQVAATNSAQHAGGSGEAGAKPATLDAAVKKHYGA